MESPSLQPPSFLRYSTKAKRVKEATDVKAGSKTVVVKVEDKSGRLRYIVMNLNDATNIIIHLELDGDKIFNHSVNDFNNAAAGDLAIGTTNVTAGMINIATNSGDDAAIVFDFNACPLPFNHKMRLWLEVVGDTDKSINAAFVLYDLFLA